MRKHATNWDVHLTKSGWCSTLNVSACGYVFTKDGELLSGEELCRYFDVPGEQLFRERVQTSNGLFSVVCHSDQLCAAAVDPSRIYPLYYRMDEDQIRVSDDPHTLLIAGDTLDAESVREYNVAGYPLGAKTLVRDVLQVLPGGMCHCDGRQERCYSYIASKTELHHFTDDEALCVLRDVFKRLIQSVGNRQIVVPLSGGNDSRLIVCMLRSLQYDNVICYTVGKPKNVEEVVAVQVAKKLGYPLYLIDTSTKELQDCIQLDSTEFQHYYRHVGNLGNFMWLFEYVAIKWLKTHGLLQDDAVFVPGHSADFNAGSQLLKAAVEKRSRAGYQADAMMFDHFEYAFDRKVYKKLRRWFLAEEKTDIAAWSLFQMYVFSHKLPYNINNSARVYQFFGYDVRLPYWDKAFLELFRIMPFENLDRCNFYTRLLREHVFQKMDVDFSSPLPSNWYYYRMKFTKRIKRLLFPSVRRNVHQHDPLGELLLSRPMFDELVSRKQYTKNTKRYANEVMKDWYLLKVKELLSAL